MMDVQTVWRRVKGRWATLRHVPSLFLFTSSHGAEGEAQALAAFGHWCEANAGMRCRVGLSGTWLLQCVPELGRDQPPIKQQALQQWAHYLDMDEASLERDWVLRDVRLPASGLMCAVPRTLVDGLLKHAEDHGVGLEWVGPWWARGVQTWLNTLASQAGEVDGISTLHLTEPGLVTHLQAHSSPGQPGTLKRIWCDRDVHLTMGKDARRVSIGAPVLDSDPVGSASMEGLWAHAALQPVLTGLDACWKVQA